MQAYLLINTLFKTAEYKLVHSDCLKITELSLFGANSKKVLLNSIKREDGQSVPSFVPYLVLILGFITLVSAIYLSQHSTILSNNLMNIIFFFVSATAALAFICYPSKTIIYSDAYSKSVLLKINKSSMINNATDQFVTDLDEAIHNTKTEESNRINLKKNAKTQYEMHNKNVDDLFNLGLIDEALYNRICSSMQENVFGKITSRVVSNNVIYLNR